MSDIWYYILRSHKACAGPREREREHLRFMARRPSFPAFAGDSFPSVVLGSGCTQLAHSSTLRRRSARQGSVRWWTYGGAGWTQWRWRWWWTLLSEWPMVARSLACAWWLHTTVETPKFREPLTLSWPLLKSPLCMFRRGVLILCLDFSNQSLYWWCTTRNKGTPYCSVIRKLLRLFWHRERAEPRTRSLWAQVFLQSPFW